MAAQGAEGDDRLSGALQRTGDERQQGRDIGSAAQINPGGNSYAADRSGNSS